MEKKHQIMIELAINTAACLSHKKGDKVVLLDEAGCDDALCDPRRDLCRSRKASKTAFRKT